MAGVVNSSGTANFSGAVNTPQTLATITSPTAVYQLIVDVSNMVSGDTLLAYANTIVLNGGTARSVLYQTFTGAPTGNGDQVWYSAPFFSDQSIAFILNQSTGSTGVAFPWKIIQY